MNMQELLQKRAKAIKAQEEIMSKAASGLTAEMEKNFNDLQQEFEEQGSEMETAARECIAADFEAIARAYGFADADVQELIAPREW